MDIEVQNNNICGDENSRIYQTLLQSQLLGVENPHVLEGGTLSEKNTFSDTSLTQIKTQGNLKILDFGQNPIEKARGSPFIPL